MIAPADADSILAVGAVDSSALLASFSSRGPTYDGRIKPEVVARGVLTFAAYADAPGTYTWGNGTSLSTPLVAGAAALILEAHPEWTPMMVRQALMMTADRSLAPDNEYGFGLIDVVAAMEYDFDVVPGDVTNDGLLNISDAVLVLEWVLTQPDLEPDQFEGADINQDGELNISDIIVIIEWILTL